MPRLKPLTPTDDDRSKLAAWTRRPKTAQRLALRARIVLAAADGHSSTTIAADLRVAAIAGRSLPEETTLGYVMAIRHYATKGGITAEEYNRWFERVLKETVEASKTR